MMNDRFEPLLKVCDVAEYYIEVSKSIADNDDDRIISILRTLLASEELLDAGRATEFPGDNEINQMQTVGKRLEDLRGEILALMKRLGKDRVVELQKTRMRSLETEWIASI